MGMPLSRTIATLSHQDPLLLFMRFAWTAGAIKEAAPIAPRAIPIVAVDLRESSELAGPWAEALRAWVQGLAPGTLKGCRIAETLDPRP